MATVLEPHPRFYPDEVTLSGLDISAGMPDLARTRAADLGRAVDLRQGDAHALPFDDESFDTVVCAFGLCAIPDPDVAIDEVVRVRRPLPHVQTRGLDVRQRQRFGRGLVERLVAQK